MPSYSKKNWKKLIHLKFYRKGALIPSTKCTFFTRNYCYLKKIINKMNKQIKINEHTRSLWNQVKSERKTERPFFIPSSGQLSSFRKGNMSKTGVERGGGVWKRGSVPLNSSRFLSFCKQFLYRFFKYLLHCISYTFFKKHSLEP